MYRSFVTCEDPKGVVECGTIRKSKVGEYNNKKIETHRRRKKKEATLPPIGRIAEEERHHLHHKHHHHHHHQKQNPSSLQVMDVSKGAEKLNKLIVDSWSKGINMNDNNKEMSKDLLKESLVMFGKLQEATKYMAKLKNKKVNQQQQLHKEKESNPERGRIEEEEELPFVMRRVSSCREGGSSGLSSQIVEVQKPRHSVDGSSSGDYIDQLRNAITDSFDRQNLLSVEERVWLDRRRRKGGSCSDLAGTSSKHESSIPKAIMVRPSVQKDRSSNVIARLMGLEDIISPGSPTRIPQKRMDIEMPKVRKQQQQHHHQQQQDHHQQQQDALKVKVEVETQHKSLKDLLETMEFRGLLKNGSVDESRSNRFNSNQLSDGTPPIVLIKPFRVPESEKVQPMVCVEEEVLSSNLVLRKVRAVKENHSNGRSHIEGRIPKPKEQKDEVQVKTTVQKERHVNSSNSMLRKREPEGGGRKPVSRGSGDRKEIVSRVKEANNSSGKTRSSTHRQEKKEIAVKKVDKIQKMVGSSNAIKSVEKETVKVARNGSRTQEKAKVVSSSSRKTRNPESGGIGSRNLTSTRNTKGKKKVKKEEGVEEEKLVHVIAEVILNNADMPEYEEEDTKVDSLGEIHPVEGGGTSIVAAAEQICRREEIKPSECPPEVHCTESHSSPDSVLLNKAEQFEDQPTDTRTDDSNLKVRIQFKAFLSSSQEFLAHVEGLYPHIDFFSPNTFTTSETWDDAVAESDTKLLLLDYANELVECRSNRDSQSRHCFLPGTNTVGALRMRVSFDQLAEEVWNGVTTLKGYSKKLLSGSGSQVADSVSQILERDLKSARVMASSGVWESGWRNGFSMDEAERAVIELEKLLLDQLIDEVLLLFT